MDSQINVEIVEPLLCGRGLVFAARMSGSQRTYVDLNLVVGGRNQNDRQYHLQGHEPYRFSPKMKGAVRQEAIEAYKRLMESS